MNVTYCIEDMSIGDIRERLIVIEQTGRSMGMQMRKEAAVARLELADRQRKGLTGDAAIAHYNEWMQRYGMEYLKVKEAKA